jgi:glycosyltransferase involved in cell wall biosynthesis
VQFHGSRPDKLLAGGKRAFGAATAALLAKVDAALVLSTDELVQWQQCFPSKRFYVVDNPFVSSAPGVGPAPESSGRCMPGRPIVLFVGRLILEKGVLDLLEAFFLVRKNVDCELVFVGEGPMAARIRERIAQCEFSSDVRLTGYLEGSALSKAYCSASVLALPSYSEGFPTVFSEGMTFGLPIITTRIRGAKDHLKEGIHALFVPAHDPPALAAALERLLKDPDKRARMSEANRAKVKDFAPERVVGRYIQVFEDVLRESRCRR